MRFVGEKGSFVRHEFSLESDFEERIYRYREEIFQGSNIVRWAPLLTDEVFGDKVKPDCLIVNTDMTEWWVVEIELARRKKIPPMVDQLGKLVRVDYTKYRKEILNGLIKMGIDEKLAKDRARYFSAIPPNFLLIIDKENKEMISQAKDRDFHTLIIIPYRNSNDETRFCVPTEHQVTSPLPSLDAETIELRAPKPPEKPDIINQNWWTKIPRDSELSLCKNVMIDDGKGTFVGLVVMFEDQPMLKISNERDSVRQITKGNKVGILTAGLTDGTYNLKLKWT